MIKRTTPGSASSVARSFKIPPGKPQVSIASARAARKSRCKRASLPASDRRVPQVMSAWPEKTHAGATTKKAIEQRRYV